MRTFFVTTSVFLGIFLLSFLVLSGRASAVFSFFTPRPETSHELIRELEERHFGVSPFWLERYGLSVRSEEDAARDIDRDGLTLLQEYQYFTNPLDPDTDGDGYNDGQEVSGGYSPVGDGKLDVNANGLPDLWEEAYELHTEEDVSGDVDTDRDGLSNHGEYLYGTHPRVPDTDGDGYSDGREVGKGYDPDQLGDIRARYHIVIDKINIDAPVILSQDATEEMLQRDLQGGVIHYPGMAIPGRRGNSYIAGHSSNYSWSAGSYNTIFRDLNQVVPGDRILVSEVLASGREVRHVYEVSLSEEVEADDARIFADSQSSVLTLTTCWPLGTADRRIMVKAYLTASGEDATIVYNEDSRNDTTS